VFPLEYSLDTIHSRSPVEVTVDDDNGRYMIRKADTSGEVFNTSKELINWIKENWVSSDFCSPHEFDSMIIELDAYNNHEGVSM
jgi:bifunctional DNA-binding transcriptional regulator/antitoxin component of YhaV-PrlF toxin-antitoxin module